MDTIDPFSATGAELLRLEPVRSGRERLAVRAMASHREMINQKLEMINQKLIASRLYLRMQKLLEHPAKLNGRGSARVAEHAARDVALG